MPSEMNSETASVAEIDPNQRSQASRRPDLLSYFAAAGIGATAMYLLDPSRGRRRRHRVADKLSHVAHAASEAAGTTKRDVANHARGLAASARRRFTPDDADDIVLAERVRAHLGRTVSHPGAIVVTAQDGIVILSGPVLSRESDDLVGCVASIRGVNAVDDRLERHNEAANIPALQGDSRISASKFEFFQENWTPTARLLGMVTGGAVAALALSGSRRTNPLNDAFGLAGLALFVRGATNMPFDRLLGIGAGRRAVAVQKSINICAPLEDVFVWLNDWEQWPEWMSHVREVTATGSRGEGQRTHWVVDGPAGTTVSWDAITTRFVPGELIAWKTVDGSAIKHAGWIRLVPTDEGFTRVDVHLTYNPLAGAVGHAVAEIFRRDPKHQLDDDLARLKTTIETCRPPHDAAVRTT